MRRKHMLIQFSFANFKSFRDEATLNLLANNFKEHQDSVILEDGERVLPSVAIFGANASGKSAVLEALSVAIDLVRTSNIHQIGDSYNRLVPFLFDDKHVNEPSSFEFVFMKNGRKYEYGFKATHKQIFEEYLYVYKTQKPSLIFERKNTNEYVFRENTRDELGPIVARTSENKLFLSTATAWNAKSTLEAFEYFKNDIGIYENNYFDLNYLANQLDKNEDLGLNEFIIRFLNEADINISNYTYEVDNADDNFKADVMRRFNLTPKAVEGLKRFRIITQHKIKTDENTVEFPLNFLFESNGTKKILCYAPLIYDALINGKTIVIDEMDNGLHHEMMKYILNLFNDPAINKKRAQLIFNSHNILLLNLDYFRRDQIYFAEKDFNLGTSSLYSLDEFSVRLDDNVLKKYLEGRFGAMPNIDS